MAWECLVMRYKRLVYHFPNQAGLAPEDCDEVFQDTFLALYNQLDRIQRTDDLSGWISRVAARRTWRAVHMRRKSESERLPEGYEVDDPNLIADEVMQLKLQQYRVRLALTKLDQKCAKLLHRLFYEVDDEGYKAIAKDLGIAVGSIGPTRNRCLTKFKRILAQFGINEKTVSKLR